jgi:hypothetical protein
MFIVIQNAFISSQNESLFVFFVYFLFQLIFVSPVFLWLLKFYLLSHVLIIIQII